MKKSLSVVLFALLVVSWIMVIISWNSRDILMSVIERAPSGTFFACALAERCWEIEMKDLPSSERDVQMAGRRLATSLDLAAGNAFKMQMLPSHHLELRSLVALADWLEFSGHYIEAEKMLIIAHSLPVDNSNLSNPDISTGLFSSARLTAY